VIIFISEGRLGNQLFQYCFLDKHKKENEKVVVFGFDQLMDVFQIDEIANISIKNKLIKYFVLNPLKNILNYLGRKKIISYTYAQREKLSEKLYSESGNYVFSKGLISNIHFIGLVFSQTEKNIQKDTIYKLKFKEKYLNKAQKILSTINENHTKIFVHIRLSDYREYFVGGKSTLIPFDFIKRQIEYIKQIIEDPCFVFLSDEPNLIEEEFKYLNNKILSFDNHYGTDLAMMSLCDGAILSPSSFGWWGSYLMQNKKIVIAPKYWLGFNSGIEYPKNIISKYMTIKDVYEEEK
jgi:hypothetical protein